MFKTQISLTYLYIHPWNNLLNLLNSIMSLRRQIQKWLAQEETLRGSVGAGYTQNHSLGQVPTLSAVSLGAPPVTSLSPAVSSTCKISPQKLRGPFVTYSPMTAVEAPEVGSGSERDFVIDEGGHDGYKSSSFSDLDDQDSKPINLCKFNEFKVENQVCKISWYLMFKWVKFSNFCAYFRRFLVKAEIKLFDI